jgi:hypothetical protein
VTVNKPLPSFVVDLYDTPQILLKDQCHKTFCALLNKLSCLKFSNIATLVYLMFHSLV